jgi:hypothetical protein
MSYKDCTIGPSTHDGQVLFTSTIFFTHQDESSSRRLPMYGVSPSAAYIVSTTYPILDIVRL